MFTFLFFSFVFIINRSFKLYFFVDVPLSCVRLFRLLVYNHINKGIGDALFLSWFTYFWMKEELEKKMEKKKGKEGFSLFPPLFIVSLGTDLIMQERLLQLLWFEGASCQTVEEGREREIPISRDSRLFSSFGRVIYSTKKLNRLSSLSRSISNQTCVRRTRTEHRQPTWTQRATLPILFYILNVNEYEVCKVNRWKN